MPQKQMVASGRTNSERLWRNWRRRHTQRSCCICDATSKLLHHKMKRFSSDQGTVLTSWTHLWYYLFCLFLRGLWDKKKRHLPKRKQVRHPVLLLWLISFPLVSAPSSANERTESSYFLSFFQNDDSFTLTRPQLQLEPTKFAINDKPRNFVLEAIQRSQSKVEKIKEKSEIIQEESNIKERKKRHISSKKTP